MNAVDFPRLRQELETRVRARTGRRVRDLAIDLDADSVTLQGSACTFYDKQLAQHGVRDLLPQVRLVNAIVVHAAVFGVD